MRGRITWVWFAARATGTWRRVRLAVVLRPQRRDIVDGRSSANRSAKGQAFKWAFLEGEQQLAARRATSKANKMRNVASDTLHQH